MEEASSNKDQYSFKREPPSSGDEGLIERETNAFYVLNSVFNKLVTLLKNLFTTTLA